MDSLFANYGSDDEADDDVAQPGQTSGGGSQGRGSLISPLPPPRQAGPAAGGAEASRPGQGLAGKPAARSFLSSLPPPRSGPAASSPAGLQGPARPSRLSGSSPEEEEDEEATAPGGAPRGHIGTPSALAPAQGRGSQAQSVAREADRRPTGLLSSLPAPGGGLRGLLSNLPAPKSKGISDMLPQAQRSTPSSAGAKGGADRAGKAGGPGAGLAGKGVQLEPETGKRKLVSFTLPLNMSLLKGAPGEEDEDEEEERARKKRQSAAVSASAAKGKSGLAALLPPPQSEQVLGGGHALGAGDGDGGWGGGGGGGTRLMLDDDDDDYDEGDVVADALTSMPPVGAGSRAGDGTGLRSSSSFPPRGESQASLASKAAPAQHTSNEAFRVSDFASAAPGPGAGPSSSPAHTFSAAVRDPHGAPPEYAGMPAPPHQGGAYFHPDQGQAGMPPGPSHHQGQWDHHWQQQQQHQHHPQQWQAPGAPYNASAVGNYHQQYGYNGYGGHETQGPYPPGAAGVPTAGQWAPEEDRKRPRQRWEQEAAEAAAAAEAAGLGPGANVVEVRQSELTSARVREDQLRATGIAFGPSHKPISSAKDKPDKMSRRKHQISSLYFDAKAREMDMAERRSKGMLSKAETQAKYGWS